MLMAASLLLAPMALTTSPNPAKPPSYNQVRAYVTGYNTVPAQTSSTPCTAADGTDICGRRDAVACPRGIGFGTVVEIRGTTYTCEDRLARKYDARFDISCDKDMACPPQVTGWTTIRVYAPEAEIAAAMAKARRLVARYRWWSRPIVRRIVTRDANSRNATRFVRHAANTRSRAWAISRG